MPTLSELIAQKEALEQQIREAREIARNDAINSARRLIEEFALTADELFGRKKKNVALPKYLNPQTGETWSGRGRAPKWLVGKNQNDFLVGN